MDVKPKETKPKESIYCIRRKIEIPSFSHFWANYSARTPKKLVPIGPFGHQCVKCSVSACKRGISSSKVQKDRICLICFRSNNLEFRPHPSSTYHLQSNLFFFLLLYCFRDTLKVESHDMAQGHIFLW
uniref:Uncharacterized protein n=1 Tax=Cacopsylla melanoneura TaxID=428564 RepID=A0A8D8YPH1_9HEMI